MNRFRIRRQLAIAMPVVLARGAGSLDAVWQDKGSEVRIVLDGTLTLR